MKLNLKKYEEITIEDIKALSEKVMPGKFSIISIDKNGIIAIIPFSKISLIVNNAECPILGKHTKFYILKEIRNIVFNTNIDDKKAEYKISNDNMKEYIQNKMSYFMNISMEERKEYLYNMYENLIKAHKKNIIDYNTANITIEYATDVALIIRVLTIDILNIYKKGVINDKGLKDIEIDFRKQITKIINEIINIIYTNTHARKEFNYLESYKLLNTKSAVSHAVRVLITFVDFIFYYNTNVRLGIGSKLRLIFSEYKNYYEKVMEPYNNKKHIDSLEDVFEGGLHEIGPSHLRRYAYSSSMHDIGKLDDIEYFESDSLYDKDRVEQHLFKGINILNRQGRSMESIYTMAFHHEYYGHGYGPFKSIYQAKKATNPYFTINYVITFDVLEALNCSALGYFPSKVLEIVDVYDTLMYPWFRDKRSKDILNYKDALEVMKSDYIENEVKIDPILFDIFVNYMSYIKSSDLSYLTKLKLV